MSVLYVETSALLSWMLGEPEGEAARTCIDDAETVVTSVLSSIESARALARAEQQKILSAKQVQALHGLLRRTVAQWIQMEIGQDVRERASRAFPSEPVRTLDALHLASALEFAQAFPQIELLSFDQRIRDNAEALGLPLAQA